MQNTLLKNVCSKLAVVAMTLLFVGGCATVEGVGKDVESAGEAIQDSADG